MVRGFWTAVIRLQREGCTKKRFVLVASRVPRSGSLKKLLYFQFELQFSQFQCYLADEYFSWKLTPSTASY